MRVMVLVKANEQSEAGVLPDPKMLAEMGKFNEQLVKAGVMLAGEGLRPSSQGVRVRFSGGKRTVIDGPFAETKEQLLGLYVVNCADEDAAIGIARDLRRVNPSAVYEIRPIRLYIPGENLPETAQENGQP
jgi:hypothetical protein